MKTHLALLKNKIEVYKSLVHTDIANIVVKATLIANRHIVFFFTL